MTDYSKGYAAGRKKGANDLDEGERLRAKYADLEGFKRAVFLAALPEIIRNPWQTEGKSHTTAQQMVGTAAEFAERAVARMIRS